MLLSAIQILESKEWNWVILLSILKNFNSRKINQVKKIDCREGGEYLRRQETWFIITPSTT